MRSRELARWAEYWREHGSESTSLSGAGPAHSGGGGLCRGAAGGGVGMGEVLFAAETRAGQKRHL